MKPTLQPGVSMTKRIAIDIDRTISFMGEDARVYATPLMIRDMEMVCRDLIMQHADVGEDSVGIEVGVKHLAAALPGMTVEVTATVKSVDGRRITFDVSAKDDIEQVGAGMHARFVVDTAKTVERLKAKAARRDALKK